MGRTVAVETLYTYDAAVSRYERERHHEWLCRQKRLQEIRHEQKERRQYFCQQKFYGLLLTFISAGLFCLLKDGICIILALGGIGIMTSKKMLLVNDYYFKHQRGERRA